MTNTGTAIWCRTLHQRLGPDRRHVLDQESGHQQAQEQLEVQRLRGGRRGEDHHHREDHQLPLDEPEIEGQHPADEGTGQDGADDLPEQPEEDLEAAAGRAPQARLRQAEGAGEEEDHDHVRHQHHAESRLGERASSPGLGQQRQRHHRAS